MKRYKGFLMGVLVTALAFSMFMTGTAYATTGCFSDTNGHWAETFICWLKDTGISGGYPDGTYKPNNNVTRAEMAVMLQKEFNYTATGMVLANAGVNSWNVLYEPTVMPLIYRYDSYMSVRSPSANTSYTFVMTPEFPSAIYGRQLSVTGMEFCYTASPNAYINTLTAWLGTETSNASATWLTIASDSTDRTDAACRYYAITPRALDKNSILSLWVDGRWGASGANVQLYLGRVTFFLLPTSTAVPALQQGIETLNEAQNGPVITRQDP